MRVFTFTHACVVWEPGGELCCAVFKSGLNGTIASLATPTPKGKKHMCASTVRL